MAEKRAHHNALERKRRDHIKDSFSSLRESVPALQGEKVASRALILKKAADYIQFMRRKNTAHQQDIDDLKRQNTLLESQINKINKRNERINSEQEDDVDDLNTQNTLLESEIRTLEKAKATGNFAAETSEVALVSTKTESVSSFPRESESDTSDSEAARATKRSKKLKVAGL